MATLEIIPGVLAPRSAMTGFAWPALPGPTGARALAWLFQLEQSQWLPAATLRGRQRAQLLSLVHHAFAHSPFNRRRLEEAGWQPQRELTDEIWKRLAVLTRADWQEHEQELVSQSIPKGHGSASSVVTSGSTGKPVRVQFSQLAGQFWQACTVRDHLWHRRDFQGKMVTIRFAQGSGWDYPQGKELPDWGPTTAMVTASGPSAYLNVATPIHLQAEWLVRQNPHYLTSYPSNLAALAQHFEERKWTLPNLRQARAFGEVVEPSVREACRRIWNVPLIDMYSSQEVSAIALQCPLFEHYHVQEENVLLEVLDGAGRPCQPGEIGRVVVTSLPNLAMPILRYEIGDYAEVGQPCSCGRGLMVLKRILGRARNLFTLPDGRRVWPGIHGSLEGSKLTALPPIRQFQVIQKTLQCLEMLLVMPRPLTPPEEELVRGWLERGIGHRFDVSFTYVDRIASSPTGKYEDFRSELTHPSEPRT